MGIQQLMMGMQGAPATPPPANTVAPSISGTNTVGSLMTCTQGTWTGAVSYAYRWLRNGADIGGAIASTYTTVAADEGTTLSCRVTATGAGGSTPAVSNGIAIIAAPVATNYTITAAPDTLGGFGWAAAPSPYGPQGSSAPAAPVINGVTICGSLDSFGLFYFYLAGNRVGLNDFVQLTINGKTYTKASAQVPAGVLDGGSTYWSWVTTAGLTNGAQYPVVVT